MSTDLTTAQTRTAHARWLRTTPTVAAGALGGLAVGVIARVWMRLISEDPEFTWAGSVFIVAGFTTFGFAQSIVAVARRRQARRWHLTIARTFGVIAMLPLFVAAGAVMFPTVAGCGLAYARVEWRTITRSLCVLMATGPVLFVANDLAGSFGWSLRTLAGFVIFLAIYATITWATRFTFSAQLDGWRMSPRAKVAVPLLIAVLFTILFFAGGGFK